MLIRFVYLYFQVLGNLCGIDGQKYGKSRLSVLFSLAMGWVEPGLSQDEHCGLLTGLGSSRSDSFVDRVKNVILNFAPI